MFARPAGKVRLQSGPVFAELGAENLGMSDDREAMTREAPTSIVSLAEVAVAFPQTHLAWAYFGNWTVYRLHDGIAQAAADLDREMALSGNRLGENDNWITGFCRYYREPVISLDTAFDRVPRIRRLPY